jgi:hypothetical protein
MDSDPDPAIFAHALQDADKKIPEFFLLITYFLKVHLHRFSKLKRHKKVTKQLESMFFLLFLLDNIRIWIRIQEAGNCYLVRKVI